MIFVGGPKHGQNTDNIKLAEFPYELTVLSASSGVYDSVEKVVYKKRLFLLRDKTRRVVYAYNGLTDDELDLQVLDLLNKGYVL